MVEVSKRVEIAESGVDDASLISFVLTSWWLFGGGVSVLEIKKREYVILVTNCDRTFVRVGVL